MSANGKRTVSGNEKKHDSYALAHVMIRNSLEKTCPLQAIAIEESILSDRLWSALHYRPVDRKLKYEKLSDAIRVWEDEEGKGSCAIVLDGRSMFTRQDIAQWNERRNKLIHGIVKYRPNGNHISAAKFVASAMKAAKDGLELVRQVENWSKRAKRRAESKRG